MSEGILDHDPYYVGSSSSLTEDKASLLETDHDSLLGVDKQSLLASDEASLLPLTRPHS